MAGKNFKIDPNEQMAGNSNKGFEPTKGQMQEANKEAEPIQEQAQEANKEPEPTKKQMQEAVPAEEPLQIKRRPGRPKRIVEETRTINISVPESMLEKMKIAKSCFNGSLTAYVNSAIAKDLETNYESYKQIYDQMVRF